MEKQRLLAAVNTGLFLEVDDQPLKGEDLENVMEATLKITDWNTLGCTLGLPRHVLHKIKEDKSEVSSCQHVMLQYWLDNRYASWSALVAALTNPLIDEKGLADMIAKNYPRAWPTDIAGSLKSHKKHQHEAETLQKKEEELPTQQTVVEEAKRQAKFHQEHLLKLKKKAKDDHEEMKTQQIKPKAAEAKRKVEEVRNKQEMLVDESYVLEEMFDFIKLEDAELLGGNIPIVDDDFDLSEYKFSKFAATYFQGNATHTYIQAELTHPLLALKHDVDQILALDIWVMILRFMGDLPEPVVTEPVVIKPVKEKGPSLKKSMYKTFSHRSSKGKLEKELLTGFGGDNDAQICKEGKHQGKRIASTLKKLPQEVDVVSAAATTESCKAMTNLEMIHFIIQFGVSRPEIRDEIYCQICKQLTENPNQLSHDRGWVLLSLCCGCFAPSSRLINYLRYFITKGHPEYAPYCEERLKRTLKNGPRQQPPSWLELQAAKSKKPMMLPITFMDGSTKTLLADSATTAKELCTQLSDKIGIKDPFGFSLYIGMLDKFSSLGSEGDHIMDAISQCEQFTKEMRGEERSAPWQLFFRKEIFSPWYDASDDPVGTNMIYQQIIRGIKFGEYRCDTNEKLASLAAQKCYVEFGSHLNTERITSLLPQIIPDSCLAGDGMKETWFNMIVKAYKEAPYVCNHVDRNRVKEGLVMFAKHKWTLIFSKFFEAYKISGPELPENDVIIAVNWNGVYCIDDQEHMLLESSYPEIMSVTSSRIAIGQSFTLLTARGQYTFTSSSGEEICMLVNYFIDGLRKRSRFAIATMDYQRPGEGSQSFSFRRGDLIKLANKDVMHSRLCSGSCERTGQTGVFPTECVYVLPTLTKPSHEILGLFANQMNRSV